MPADCIWGHPASITSGYWLLVWVAPLPHSSPQFPHCSRPLLLLNHFSLHCTRISGNSSMALLFALKQQVLWVPSSRDNTHTGLLTTVLF